MLAISLNAVPTPYNALPYDVLDGAYFETVELPEGPLTDIHVSSGERSSDFFTWDATKAPTQNYLLSPSTIISTE